MKIILLCPSCFDSLVVVHTIKTLGLLAPAPCDYCGEIIDPEISRYYPVSVRDLIDELRAQSRPYGGESRWPEPDPPEDLG